MVDAVFDLAIIGGGIDGCGITCDAAGRGASGVVFEQADLGSATSSVSAKLIHRGLRDLERSEFRQIYEALAGREVVRRIASHIGWPLRSILSHHQDLRPRWLQRLGLFIDDHLGGRKLLANTSLLDLTRDKAGECFNPRFERAFEYSDCSVEDRRPALLDPRDAAHRGASIRPRKTVDAAGQLGGLWSLTTQTSGGVGETARGRAKHDHVLTLDAPRGGAPLPSIFGRKITTFRRGVEA